MEKKVILALCILFAMADAALARTRGVQQMEEEIYIAYLKNEFYVQYGTPSIVEVTDKLGDRSNFKTGGTSYTGVGAVGYNRYINPYFCIGGYVGMSESELDAKDTATGHTVFTSKVKSVTGMINFGWTYFRSGIWEISCGASAGIARKDEHITKIGRQSQSVPQEGDETVFAYNLTVAKVRIGGGIIGGFAEFGFGYRGIANAGLSIKF